MSTQLKHRNLIYNFNKVMLFRLDASDYLSSATFALQKVTEWNHNYFVTSLASYSDNLVAGDHISSVSVLKVVNSQLQTVSRDYGPLWPVCVEALDEKSIIGANVCDIPCVPKDNYLTESRTP
jgi:DNA damage-binding protein 1